MAIFDINGNSLEVNNGITPEYYGAVGDGTTDDTLAIQSAFDESASSNVPVSFGYGKIYAVSSTITMTKRQDVYGNGSFIKAIDSMTSLFVINTESQHVTSSIGKGLLTNITFDCNNLASNGIYVQYSAGFAIQNVDVLRALANGYYFASGFELFCNNCRSARCPTGFNIQTNDSHFTDIVTVNADIGIKVGKESNFFDHVHSWNTVSAIVPTSIMFDVSASMEAVNCYCDTCATFVNMNANCFVFINGLKVFSSSTYMPSSIMTGITPYLFKLNSSGLTSRVKAYGITYSSNIQYAFSDKQASAWTTFDWRNNNDTTLTNMSQCPN